MSNRLFQHEVKNRSTVPYLLLFSCLLACCAWSQSFVAKPLNDLGADKYKGFQGGLYEKGSNQIPADHDAAGLVLAEQVKPIRGKFVFLSIGMSNTAMEFMTFQSIAESDSHVNHSTLAIINGAVGAMTACAWSDAHATPGESCHRQAAFQNLYDRIRDELLKPAGLAEDQVEAIWLKNADPRPDTALPAHDAEAYHYEGLLGQTVRVLRSRYPNLKLLFLSSRIYGGYATRPLNPEPYAYEYGFSVKWLIQAQVDQMRNGTIDSVAGDLDYKKGAAPWMVWGPYLWADGVSPRSDGLTWQASEFSEQDGTHPNQKGREKVAKMLLDFLLSSPYTTWFRK